MIRKSIVFIFLYFPFLFGSIVSAQEILSSDTLHDLNAVLTIYDNGVIMVKDISSNTIKKFDDIEQAEKYLGELEFNYLFGNEISYSDTMYQLDAILTIYDDSIVVIKDLKDNTVKKFDNIEDSEVYLRELEKAEEHHSPNIFSVIPFVVLLLMIATGPLFYESFWHHHYPKIAFILTTIVVCYYIFLLDNLHSPVHAFFEYFQFISLLTGLYIASGGIYIEINDKSKPILNVAILAIGAVIANLIGTTGASMLLIRPFMRLNAQRLKPYHIVFFIFIVSNVGGALTPIGDPPLFLGFLKGIPFGWTVANNMIPWLFASGILCALFYIKDIKNYQQFQFGTITNTSPKLKISNRKSFLWLLVVIIAVFIDPNIPFFFLVTEYSL